MPVLVGHDEAVTQWAALRWRPMVKPATTLGWLGSNDTLTAAVLFYDYYRGGNIDIHFVTDRPFARGFLLAVADYVFNKLGCSRMTARPPSSNESACDQLRRAGFRQEANCKAYYGLDDAIQFRMLRGDAGRWLTSD